MSNASVWSVRAADAAQEAHAHARTVGWARTRAEPAAWLAGAAALLYGVLCGLLVSLPERGFLAHTASDDAYYYFEIARRFGQDAWPTFDGTHTTTGFHPLWLWMLVPLAHVTEAWPWLFARCAVALSAALMFAAALSWGRVVARAAGERAGWLAIALLLGSAGAARLGVMGMEGPLALLLCALLLLEAGAEHPRAVVLGLWCGLVMLARLDMVLVVGLALAWSALGRRRWRLAFGAGAIAALVLAPYLAWNHALTGHFGTVSAATKSFVVRDAAAATGGLFATEHLQASLAALVACLVTVAKFALGTPLAGALALAGGDYPSAVVGGAHLPAVALGSIALCVFAWRAAGRVSYRRARTLVRAEWLALAACGAALHALLSAFLVTGQAGPWYWGLELCVIAALLALVAERGGAVAHAVWTLATASVIGIACIVVGSALALGRGNFAVRTSFGGAMLDLARQVDAQVAPGVPIGSSNAGTLGFASTHSVVNLDGLVNDFSFLEARRDGRTAEWIRAAGILYYADCLPPGGHDAYRRRLGLASAQVQVLKHERLPQCDAVLWRLHH